MKLALVIASIAVCNLVAVTGCAVSSDDSDGREETKNEGTSDPSSIDQNEDKTRAAEKKGDTLDAPLTPTMACRIWEWVDGRRICRW